MNNPRITSLAALKDWNATGTAEPKPIVLEWFMDYFFELLDANNTTEAADALEAVVVFSEKVEQITRREAEERCIESLCYSLYASTRWPAKLDALFKQTEWTQKHRIVER